MKPIITPIILQLAGVAVVFAEIFIPSGGLLGLIAAGLLGYSIFLAFTVISQEVGYYFLIGDIIGLPFMIYWGIKMLSSSPATLNTTLSSQQGVTSQNPKLKSLLYHRGIALADLRPSGPAQFNEQRLDVVSRGEYIDKGTKIQVISVMANQLVVSAIEDDDQKINHRGESI